MTIRKLASIRRIAEIQPIEGADAIEAVRVDGWWVVAKKGEYKVDDLAVYFEIDSFIPTEIAPFLTKPDHFPKEYEGVKGERLKTVRLRGQLSQGLVLPVTILPPCVVVDNHPTGTVPAVWLEGDDVTEALGILKYDPPVGAEMAGLMRGNWPSWIPHTDQERIQNLTNYWSKHWDLMFEGTIKLDGSSTTIYHCEGDDSGVCSRNINLKETDDNTFWKTTRKQRILEALEALGRNLAVQGELMGPGIQDNWEKLDEHRIFVFDIFDKDQGRYLTAPERFQVLGALNGLGADIEHVPILSNALTAFQTYPTTQAMLDFAGSGPSLNNPIREGVVFKSTTLVNGETISFKAISNVYLEKRDKRK